MRTIATALLLLVCACTSANSAPPPSSGPSTHFPPTHVVDPAGRPDGVTAVWTPDMNWKHGHRVVTHGNAALARELSHDIDVAPPIPLGVFSCPMDSGIAVDLTIRLDGKERHASVRLSGCHAVDVPGRRSLKSTNAFDHDLATIAPPRWKQWVG